MKHFSKQSVLSRFYLILVTIIWGTSFVAVSGTNDFFKPAFLLALRFSSAFILLIPFFLKDLKKLNKRYFINGAIIGIIIFAGYYIQAAAITTAGGLPGRCSFLVSTYCVQVPFTNWLINHKKPSLCNIAAGVVCIIGVTCISFHGLVTETGSANLGDILALISSVLFSVLIVMLPRLSNNLDTGLFTLLQFLFSGAYAWLFTMLFESGYTPVWTTASILLLFYLSAICTAAAVLLQTAGQKNTSPAAAAIIFSLEAVFGIILSMFIFDEKVSLLTAAGCFCIFAAIIISEAPSFKTAKPNAG